MKQIRIALICQVGFEAYWYPLGISMLKENLERCTNVRVDNYYLSSEFSWYIDRYYPRLEEINDQIGEEGNCYHEIYFSTKLFNHGNPRALIEKVFLDECNGKDIYKTRLNKVNNLGKIPKSEMDFTDGVMEYCSLLDLFISKKVKEANWLKYDMIGFSCLSSQLLCSVYMAKRIRQLGFTGTLVFGGGMFRKWNVSQYVRLFPFIDRFIVGDGFKAILDMIGIRTGHVKRYSDDIQNHYGDFSDVPRKVYRSRKFIFPVQLSDYCSWRKCLFCSIQHGQYRKVSERIVYDWIMYATKKYGAVSFGFVDSDLNGNMIKFEKVCSALAKADVDLDFNGMLNTRNLTRQLCMDLKAAGFSFVLLGVENFNDRMLSKMKKRSNILDNIKALKWLVEAGIEEVVFNIIIDFPGTVLVQRELDIFLLRLRECPAFGRARFF